MIGSHVLLLAPTYRTPGPTRRITRGKALARGFVESVVEVSRFEVRLPGLAGLMFALESRTDDVPVMHSCLLGRTAATAVHRSSALPLPGYVIELTVVRGATR